MSKYVLVTTLILGDKDYKDELSSLVKMLRETADFKVGGWTFNEILDCLNDTSLQRTKKELVQSIIALLKNEISPDDFVIS